MESGLSKNRLARIAGSLYVGVILTGVFSLMYVPSRLMVNGHPELTYPNLLASETLFRFWIVGGLLCYTLFLFLLLALFNLLQDVHLPYARLMVLLGIMSVPIYFLNAQHQFDVLSLLHPSDASLGLASFDIPSHVNMALEQYDNGMRMVHIFSGLWLIPFGYLVYTSGFLPKILGVLLCVGGFGYIINFLGHTLIPEYQQMGVASYIRLPASLGEIGIGLWLLFKGVKAKIPTDA